MKKIMSFFALLLIFIACTPQSVVQNYLDTIVQGKNGGEYLVEDPKNEPSWIVTKSGEVLNKAVLDDSIISDFKVMGYEILNTSGNVVSARIIFASKAGTDLPKTFKFQVESGKITRIW